MIIHQIIPNELNKVRMNIVRFMRRYGDGRITHHAIRWFQSLNSDKLKEDTLIAATLDGKKITGIIGIGNYGIDEAFIAVHPDYRKRGIGESLLQYSLQHLDKIYTRVAFDNTPSLKLCFSCGLIAFQLFKGPTGKLTLWFAGGNWNPKDVEHKCNKPFA